MNRWPLTRRVLWWWTGRKPSSVFNARNTAARPVSVTGEPLQLGLEALCEALGDAAFLLLALRGVAVEFDLRHPRSNA
jgi:hypothetical protein